MNEEHENTDGLPEKRKKGRPRTAHLKPDKPKRPRGRPKKVMPTQEELEAKIEAAKEEARRMASDAEARFDGMEGFMPSLDMDSSKLWKVQLEAQYRAKMANLAEVKLAKMRNELIAFHDLEEILKKVFMQFKLSLYAGVNNLPAQIYGQSEAKIRDVIYAHIDTSITKANDQLDDLLSNLNTDTEIEDDEG